MGMEPDDGICDFHGAASVKIDGSGEWPTAGPLRGRVDAFALEVELDEDGGKYDSRDAGTRIMVNGLGRSSSVGPFPSSLAGCASWRGIVIEPSILWSRSVDWNSLECRALSMGIYSSLRR